MLKGQPGEDWAVVFLVSQGLTIRTRNYHCRWGEIDVVAEQGGKWIFIEVRSRQRPSAGLIDTINRTKQRRWWLASQHYLAHIAHPPPPCRFDILLLEGQEFFCTTWVQAVELSTPVSRGNY
ncbi:MAG: YraN family protein [Betaproteobacteria bacterium]|jgi:Predicted endonuclease distantly related to archaeal Holliday junction resolvase|nr:YraN family protein [Betaproteobacteria bacterium]